MSYPLTQLPQNEQMGDPTQGNTDELHEEDEKFGFFRNQAAKKVLQAYLAVLGSEKKNKTEDEDVERRIIELARLDAWIITVVICLTDSDITGGRLRKLYTETFEKYLSIDMDQICSSFHSYVEKWEPEDLDSSELSNYQLSIGEGICE